MVKETLQFGDARLKASNKMIEKFNSPELKQLVDDLINSMRGNDLIGIAGPQIGENWKVFVTEPRVTEARKINQADELRIYINPKIVKESEEKVVIWEGCGSYFHGQLFGPVERPKEITIEASDVKGKRFQLICDGLLARVIQHENDHLDGIEFIDRIPDLKQLKNIDFYMQTIRGSEEAMKATIITKKEFQLL